MVDPVRHTLHLYKTAGATQNLAAGAGVYQALTWSAREPSGPPPDGMAVSLTLGEITFNVSGRFLMLVSGGFLAGTAGAGAHAQIRLERKPKGGAFAAVDKGTFQKFNAATTSNRAFGFHSLVKVSIGDTWRVAIAGDAAALDTSTFNAASWSVVGMGQINP